MPMLRTLIRIWVVFLIGAGVAVAFVALTPPLATRVADMAVGLAVFGGGLLAGLALDRFAHGRHGPASAQAEAKEPVKELVTA